MVGVEQWAELRREHFVRGVSIKERARRTGLSRNTVRAALRSPEPPHYRREAVGSRLEPFKDEIHPPGRSLISLEAWWEGRRSSSTGRLAPAPGRRLQPRPTGASRLRLHAP